MSKWGKIDYKALEALKKRFERLSEEQINAFCIAGAKELAARLLRRVVKDTPVGQYPSGSGKIGGTLKGNWRIDLNVIKKGDTFIITVYNNTYYASYVEYGHRTRGHKGWIVGRFMLTKNEILLQSQAPAILERKLNKMLQEVFKSGK